MNKLTSIIVACLTGLVLAAGAKPSSESDKLVFSDGDWLNGKLLSIDSQRGILWQHPDAAQPVEFKADNVTQIEFPLIAPPEIGTNSPCKVFFTGGDMLEGNIVSCDHEALTLDTWYGGQLKIQRSALRSVELLSPTPPLYEGPKEVEGWTLGMAVAAFGGESGQWSFRNNAFYANKPASIARDVHLPDEAELDFDLIWKGSLNLAVALYTDSLQPILLSNKENGPDFGGFYSLMMLNIMADLRPIKKRDPITSLGQTVLPNLTQSRTHVSLLMSKPQHKIDLYLDGKLAKQWIDPNGFAGEGTGLRFVHNGGGAIKLFDLRVTKWDGIEKKPSADLDRAHDNAQLKNGDMVAGAVEAIADGKVMMSMEKGKIDFPLARIKEILFAQTAKEPPMPSPDSVRATFAQGGAMTFHLDTWSESSVLIHSPAFGKATINPTAFSRFEFHPAPEAKTAPDGTE